MPSPRVKAPLLLGLGLLGFAAACEQDLVSEANPRFEVQPTEVDFGTVELGQQAERTVVVRNLESIRGKVSSIDLVDNCDGCFLVLNDIGVVRGFSEERLGLRFRAVRLAIATATVSIATDDPRNPVLEVRMVGRGDDRREPDVEVRPESIDFGFVPAGGVALASFSVRSTGTNDLLIDRISIDPPGAPFRITTSTPTPERPGILEPGAQASVSLKAEIPATQNGTVTASVLIETNVLREKNVPGRPGVVRLPLHALANLPPLAITGPDQTVEPWSRATLDGSKSHDQDNPPDEPLSFRWSFVTLPPGSTTSLERATGPNPSFWVDVTGRYEIALVVTDALGLESEPAVTVVEALPSNAIRIELTWDHPDSDLDLHLIRENGLFCDCMTDVHYRDCGRAPNWFPSMPGANPRLDVDDRSGFGPENINIDGEGTERLVPDGRYQIAVHYYASNAGISSWPTTVSVATVRVFVFGLLAAEFTRPMQEDGELWVAGVIKWPEQVIEPVNAIAMDQICGVF